MLKILDGFGGNILYYYSFWMYSLGFNDRARIHEIQHHFNTILSLYSFYKIKLTQNKALWAILQKSSATWLLTKKHRWI